MRTSTPTRNIDTLRVLCVSIETVCSRLYCEDQLRPTELISVLYRFAKGVHIKEESEAEVDAASQNLAMVAFSTFCNTIL